MRAFDPEMTLSYSAQSSHSVWPTRRQVTQALSSVWCELDFERLQLPAQNGRVTPMKRSFSLGSSLCIEINARVPYPRAQTTCRYLDLVSRLQVRESRRAPHAQ